MDRRADRGAYPSRREFARRLADGTRGPGTGRDRMSTRESVPTDTRRAAGACPPPIQTALDVSAPRGRERLSPS
jgi:hypothetical protein